MKVKEVRVSVLACVGAEACTATMSAASLHAANRQGGVRRIVTAVLKQTHESQNTQLLEVRFHATLGEEPEVKVVLD